MAPRVPVVVKLPRAVHRAAALRAARCGLPLGVMLSELVESHLAQERCGHGAQVPAGPPPGDDGEDEGT